MNYFTTADELGYDAYANPTEQDAYMNSRYYPSLDSSAGYGYMSETPQQNVEDVYPEWYESQPKKKKTNWVKVAGYTAAIASAALAYKYRGKIAKKAGKATTAFREKVAAKIAPTQPAQSTARFEVKEPGFSARMEGSTRDVTNNLRGILNTGGRPRSQSVGGRPRAGSY